MNDKNILSARGVEHQYYFQGQLLAWLLMALVWDSIFDYYRSGSDLVQFFIPWNVMMFLFGISVSHFFLRPVYWWLSRTKWRSLVKILVFFLAIHLSIWILLLAERALFLFAPVPIEQFDWSWLNVLILYHVVMISWGFLYHCWTWESYHQDSLPKENSTYYVLGQVLGWLAVGFFWYVLYTGRGEDVELEMTFFWSWVFKVYSSGIILSHCVLRPFYRHLLSLRSSMTAKLLLSIGGIYVCTILGEFISYLWKDWSNIGELDRTDAENFAGVTVAFISFGVWSLLYCGWLTWQQKLDETTRRLRLEASYQEAQMSSLKQQLNPHFIFNALNSLRALIIQDQHLARKMVTEISSLLRYTLYESEKDTVPLSDEIKIVKNYLAIELMRYEGRISVTWDIPERFLSVHVIPLCIQTLVENAIKHNINQYEDGIFIRIHVLDNGANMQISVCNRGRIFSQERDGIGLANTRERLALVFGENSSLALTQKQDDVVEAVLMMPKTSVSEGVLQ